MAAEEEDNLRFCFMGEEALILGLLALGDKAPFRLGDKGSLFSKPPRERVAEDPFRGDLSKDFFEAAPTDAPLRDLVGLLLARFSSLDKTVFNESAFCTAARFMSMELVDMRRFLWRGLDACPLLLLSDCMDPLLLLFTGALSGG